MSMWKIALAVALCGYAMVVQAAMQPGWYVHEEDTVYQARAVIGNGDLLDIYCVQESGNEVGIVLTRASSDARQYGTGRDQLAGINVDGQEYIGPSHVGTKGGVEHFYALMNALRTAHHVSVEIIDGVRRITIPVPTENLSSVLPPTDAELRGRCPVGY